MVQKKKNLRCSLYLLCICIFLEPCAAGTVFDSQLCRIWVSDRLARAGSVPWDSDICTFFNFELNRSSRFVADAVIGCSA